MQPQVYGVYGQSGIRLKIREVTMTFCDKLQILRKSKGLTQEDLADKINVSRAAVAKWEAG